MTDVPVSAHRLDLLAGVRGSEGPSVRLEYSYRVAERLGLFAGLGLDREPGAWVPSAMAGLRWQIP